MASCERLLSGVLPNSRSRPSADVHGYRVGNSASLQADTRRHVHNDRYRDRAPLAPCSNGVAHDGGWRALQSGFKLTEPTKPYPSQSGPGGWFTAPPCSPAIPWPATQRTLARSRHVGAAGPAAFVLRLRAIAVAPSVRSVIARVCGSGTDAVTSPTRTATAEHGNLGSAETV